MASQGKLAKEPAETALADTTPVASEYERNQGASTLQPFFDSSIPRIRHPEVQQWGRDLMTERERRRQSEALP